MLDTLDRKYAKSRGREQGTVLNDMFIISINMLKVCKQR